jgi:hypothetical protein
VTFGEIDLRPAQSAGVEWPLGPKWIGNNELQSHLENVSSIKAREVLTKYASPDPVDLIDAAMAMGHSIELLMKAYLASLSPAILAERDDFHSKLMLAGQAGLSSKDYRSVRTMGAEASLLAILSMRQPPRGFSKADVTAVLAVRNSSAHLGLVRSEDLSDAVSGFVVAVGALLKPLNISSADYWGVTHLQLASELENRTVDSRRVAVHERRISASVRFASARAAAGDSWEAVRALLIESSEPLASGGDDELVLKQECPTCHSQAWMTGTIEMGEVIAARVDFHDVEYVVKRSASMTNFNCGVCGLELEDYELEIAGLPAMMELEDGDADYEMFEEQEYVRFRWDKWAAE